MQTTAGSGTGMEDQVYDVSSFLCYGRSHAQHCIAGEVMHLQRFETCNKLLRWGMVSWLKSAALMCFIAACVLAVHWLFNGDRHLCVAPDTTIKIYICTLMAATATAVSGDRCRASWNSCTMLSDPLATAIHAQITRGTCTSFQG